MSDEASLPHTRGGIRARPGSPVALLVAEGPASPGDILWVRIPLWERRVCPWLDFRSPWGRSGLRRSRKIEGGTVLVSHPQLDRTELDAFLQEARGTAETAMTKRRNAARPVAREHLDEGTVIVQDVLLRATTGRARTEASPRTGRGSSCGPTERILRLPTPSGSPDVGLCLPTAECAPAVTATIARALRGIHASRRMNSQFTPECWMVATARSALPAVWSTRTRAAC
jgi:hypothetical protein